MSVIGKNWLIKNQSENKSVVEKILENRGFTEIQEMVDFHDPFLFEDMEKTVKRITQAIKAGELIVVFGDYDVDGISGTAILIHILRELKANVIYRLPNRVSDGYGLSDKFIEEFIKINVKLLITVDCGISCENQIAKAKNANIDTIITDHHTIPALEPKSAFAVLHPRYGDCQYPFKDLTGAGMALKLAHALIKSNFAKQDHDKYLDCFLDLASLGTIADLGSLVGENRLIVKRGLKTLENTKWTGLKKIKELANIKEGDTIDTIKIGFQIAPRINAAGRIGDPNLALKLLLNEVGEVSEQALSKELESLNKERQNMTEKALNEVEEFFSSEKKLPYILVAHNKNWHVGILGLVAGKLAEKYHKPVIMLQDLGDTLTASARSPIYFNIVEALTNFKHYLTSFGGHAQAAGFNLKKENLEKFTLAINEYAKIKLANTELKSTLEIDCSLKEEELSFDLLSEVEKLGPFGLGNQKPIFVMQSVSPHFIEQVGQDSNHLKFSLQIGTKEFRVIAFRMGQYADILKQQQKIDLVFSLNRNHWQDRDYIQIEALDFAFCE